MNEKDIDRNILLMAEAHSMNMSEQTIIDSCIKNGFCTDDIFLLLSAAKILYQDRKDFIPPKPMFKRGAQ